MMHTIIAGEEEVSQNSDKKDENKSLYSVDWSSNLLI